MVGVIKPGLQHVGGDYRSMPHGETVDAWWPIELPPQASRGSHYMNAIGRLKPGVSVTQAEADFKTISERLAKQFPDTNDGWSAAVKPLHRGNSRAITDDVAGNLRSGLLCPTDSLRQRRELAVGTRDCT